MHPAGRACADADVRLIRQHRRAELRAEPNFISDGEKEHGFYANSLRDELNRMANLQFETPEFERLLSVRLTLPRARFYIKHNAYYSKNRRDCWGFVLGAPFDVKNSWKHEEDDLSPTSGKARHHYSLVVRQAQMVGVTREEIEQSEPIPGARARSTPGYIARNRPVVEAFTSSTDARATQQWRNHQRRRSVGAHRRCLGGRLGRCH